MSFINKFRGWKIAKILPLVYDDTLSFTELMGKFGKKLNELINSNNALTDDVKNIESTINAVTGGNVVTEINGKLASEGKVSLGADDIPVDNDNSVKDVLTEIGTDIDEIRDDINDVNSRNLIFYVDVDISATSGESVTTLVSNITGTASLNDYVIGKNGKIGKISTIVDENAYITSTGKGLYDMLRDTLFFANVSVPTESETAITISLSNVYGDIKVGDYIVGKNGYLCRVDSINGYGNAICTALGTHFEFPDNAARTSLYYVNYDVPTSNIPINISLTNFRPDGVEMGDYVVGKNGYIGVINAISTLAATVIGTGENIAGSGNNNYMFKFYDGDIPTTYGITIGGYTSNIYPNDSVGLGDVLLGNNGYVGRITSFTQQEGQVTITGTGKQVLSVFTDVVKKVNGLSPNLDGEVSVSAYYVPFDNTGIQKYDMPSTVQGAIATLASENSVVFATADVPVGGSSVNIGVGNCYPTPTLNDYVVGINGYLGQITAVPNSSQFTVSGTGIQIVTGGNYIVDHNPRIYYAMDDAEFELGTSTINDLSSIFAPKNPYGRYLEYSDFHIGDVIFVYDKIEVSYLPRSIIKIAVITNINVYQGELSSLTAEVTSFRPRTAQYFYAKALDAEDLPTNFPTIGSRFIVEDGRMEELIFDIFPSHVVTDNNDNILNGYFVVGDTIEFDNGYIVYVREMDEEYKITLSCIKVGENNGG